MASNEEGIGASEVAAGDRIGPYEVHHRVARGGMASVIAVRDTRDGAMRAMKLLLPIDEGDEAKTRFRREFRALSRLSHPGILRVFEWGLHNGRPWFTMELLGGNILKHVVESWQIDPPRDRFERVERILTETTRALAYAHDRGLVHRDVTPSNIMIAEDGSARLMDFGVVKDLGTDLTRHGEMIGTVAYISPEQITGDVVDARADLYSLGAVLYLMLTGQRPFKARNLHGYLDKHLHEVPRPPGEVDPLVPEHLDHICMRLLAKDPADRYASAAHLLHVLGDVHRDEDEDGWPPRAVGRTLHSARVRDAVDQLAQTGIGNALLLSGAPGMGKTRLVQQGMAYARRLGLLVARGRCREQDRPFGAFIGVYRALVGDSPPPLLDQVFGSVDDGVLRERYPIIRAFRELLVQRAPVLVVLDDLHNADPATSALLEYLVRNTLELQSEGVLFLLAQDATHNTGAERRVEDIEAISTVHVGPLGAAEVEELVLGMLPNDERTRTLARRLHKESGGVPAFLSDMLRGLVDEGVLQRDAEGWRLTLDPTEITRSRLPIPSSLREAIEDRLRLLPKDAVEVARTMAVSRQRLGIDALLVATRMDEDRVLDALDALEEASLVQERRDGELELFELAQGRVRDVLMERLSPAGRRERHQRLGEVLERQHRNQVNVIVEELAYQFEQAGLAPKAYAFLMQTARRHLHRGLNEDSMVFIERALKLEPVARPLMLLDDADRTLSELHLARGTAQFRLGRWADALASLESSRDLATVLPNPALQSRVFALYGDALRNMGRNDEAESAIRTALLLADEANDPSLRPMPLYHLGALVWRKDDLDSAERYWLDAVASAQASQDDRALGYGYNGLGILATCRGATAQARSHLEQSAALFSELGVLDALAMARVNLAELYLSTGILNKALALAERTVAQAREADHPQGIVLGLAYRAKVLLEIGRCAEAELNAAEALRVVRNLATGEDEAGALAVLARVAVTQRQPLVALTWLDQLDPILVNHDSEGLTSQAAAWRAHALALLGQHDKARSLLAAPITRAREWPHVQVYTALARGRAFAATGDLTSAREAFHRALTLSEKHGYRFYQLCCHHALLGAAASDGERATHRRIGMSLARSVAGSLPLDQGKAFIRDRWTSLDPSVERP